MKRKSVQADDHVQKTIAVYDRIADAYAQKQRDHTLVVEQSTWMTLVPKGGLMLDAGSCAGRDTKFFHAHGYRVIGIDLSEKLLAIARKVVPHVEFLRMDIRHLIFHDRMFVGVWANAILHHLKRNEVPAVITQFHRVLAPGGVLFIAVHEGTGEAQVTDTLSPDVARQYTYMTLLELTGYVKDAGFEIISSYVWNEKDRNPDHRDLQVISLFVRK